MPPKTRRERKAEVAVSTTGGSTRATQSGPVSSSTVPAQQAPPVTLDYKKLNPKTTHYEFGGPIGAFLMITILPCVVILFAFGCDNIGYTPFHRLWAIASDLIAGRFEWEFLWSLVTSWKAVALLWYAGFVAQLATFSIAMPGDTVEGTRLRDGTRLSYKVNALSAVQTMTTMTLMSVRGQGLKLPLWVHANFAHIAVASVIFSFIVSIGVYVYSFFGKRLLSLGGNTGNHIYDFMIGHELNPRIGNFDLKFFTELRPGLVGWVVLNICMALKQYVDLGRVTNSMILVVLFQAWYVFDALWNETSVLTTMDITSDGFGFMLAFGNFCWVPMMYCLQARYLADFPHDLNIWHVCAVIILQCVGYRIFRGANSQKNTFRNNPEDPSVKDLTYIQTKSGTRLITSGWWGMSRHINYFGDWLMALSWCLACGFDSIIPYFYSIYFLILLVHRQRRDDSKCKEKYGEDWDKYCEIVKYRIVPGVY
ncbi:ergosterol biosynthesis ERG4/ERG24 [Phycomyces blakesleeanus]